MNVPHNPYAAPGAAVLDVLSVDNDAERLRSAHLRHEIALQSVGSLYWFGCMLTAFGSIGMALALLYGRQSDASAMLAGVLAVYAVLVLVFGVLGYGFRRLRPWVRIPATLLAVPGLFAFPVGTLIQGYILYLMFGAKGRVVLGPGYADIVAATPHLRYRRTVGDWIALGIVVALLAGGFAFVAFNLR